MITTMPGDILQRLAENDYNFEECISTCIGLAEEKDGVQFLLGDIASAVGKRYGDDLVGKLAYGCKYETSTLRKHRAVSEFFPHEIRISFSELRWSHFWLARMYAVKHADRDLEEAIEWLQKASELDYSIRDMRQAINDCVNEPRSEVIKIALVYDGKVGIDHVAFFHFDNGVDKLEIGKRYAVVLKEDSE